MKILHITPSLLGGGIGAVVCHLANEMAKTNDVMVCSIFEPQSTDIFWHRLSPSVHKTTCHKVKSGVSLKVLFQIARLIRQGHFDAVHIHGFLTYYLLAIALCPKDTKFFYTIHSDAWRENSKWDKRIFAIKKHLFSTQKLVPITISKASQRSFEQLYHCKSYLVYNAIQKAEVPAGKNDLISQMRLTPQTRVFVNPARVDYPKNQVVLCRVFKTLIEQGHDVALVIAGWKAHPNIYEAFKPYLSNRIRYVGERTDIIHLLNDSDGMCLPSVYEGLPIVLLEALSVGCVPICSPVGGIVDVVKNGWNGFLSASSSYDDYLATMQEALSTDKPQWQQIKERSLLSFEDYNIVNTAAAYCEIYKQKQ